MRRRKVLYVVHNHPRVRPGGTEVYALELYAAMQGSTAFEPFLLARAETRMPRMTPFAPAGAGDPRQYVIHTDRRDVDHLMGTSRRSAFYMREVRRFLEAVRPDVVHFQHALFLGYEIVSEVRRTLPSAAIVYTLHDFHPICHRDGQMVRRGTDELCDHASPRRCHGCFPDVSPAVFAERERFVKGHLSPVDLFVAPSDVLRDRYLAWGLAPEKIVVEDYGRLPTARMPEPSREGPRNRLGFFGQVTPFKGVDVLLEAMKLLKTQNVPVRLSIHGANLELADHDYRRRIETLLADACDAVTLAGPYDRSELPYLMADVDWVVVPSIWWENSPLVIQEAFAHGRPVICSDIGGMAEKINDGVNGVHFPAGDPAALAETIEHLVDTPDAWDTLRRGIPRVHSMDDHVRLLESTYDRLLAAPRGVAA